jgi:hypothetical protein
MNKTSKTAFMMYSLFSSNDDESNGSKERRGAYTRRPDGELKIVYKEKEQHMQIKNPTLYPKIKYATLTSQS